MTSAVFPVLCAALFALTVAHNHCSFYRTSSGKVNPFSICHDWWPYNEFCCGTCVNRYCCSNPREKLSEAQQKGCFQEQFMTSRRLSLWSYHSVVILIISIVAGAVGFILLIIFITCCVSPSCYLYKKCRRPVTTTTAVATTQHLPQQTAVNRNQHQSYQLVPSIPEYPGHPAYGGHPIPTAPYRGLSDVPEAPPSYQEAVGLGYPVSYSQPAYNGDQTTYPIRAPAQSSQKLHSTDYTSPPAFNPAYVEPPNTSC